MKLLLDECIDRRLAKELHGHEVKTVSQMGWAGIENGALLALAETEFEFFITVDRILSFQQNLSRFNIAAMVLHAPSHRLVDLRPLAPKIFAALPTLTKGAAEHVHA